MSIGWMDVHYLGGIFGQIRGSFSKDYLLL